MARSICLVTIGESPILRPREFCLNEMGNKKRVKFVGNSARVTRNEFWFPPCVSFPLLLRGQPTHDLHARHIAT